MFQEVVSTSSGVNTDIIDESRPASTTSRLASNNRLLPLEIVISVSKSKNKLLILLNYSLRALVDNFFYDKHFERDKGFAILLF